MTRASLFLAAVCFGLLTRVLAGAPLASAQDAPLAVDPIDIPPEHDPLAHAWDVPSNRGGFYLRASLGLGVQGVRLGPPSWQDGNGQSARGFATGYTLDIGGMLAPWVALHANAHAGVLWNGNVDYDLNVAGVGADDIRVTGFGLAPAATFFVPHDFFFTTAFGVGLARSKSGGDGHTTDPGFYMDLVAGKELYRDRHVGVGLQFQVVYMRLGDENKAYETRLREFLFGVSIAYDSI